MFLIVTPKDAFAQKGLWFENQNRMYKTAVLKGKLHEISRIEHENWG
jgi:hypothetical protein